VGLEIVLKWTQLQKRLAELERPAAEVAVDAGDIPRCERQRYPPF
jgi:hypothetical protein